MTAVQLLVLVLLALACGSALTLLVIRFRPPTPINIDCNVEELAKRLAPLVADGLDDLDVARVAAPPGVPEFKPRPFFSEALRDPKIAEQTAATIARHLRVIASKQGPIR